MFFVSFFDIRRTSGFSYFNVWGIVSGILKKARRAIRFIFGARSGASVSRSTSGTFTSRIDTGHN